MSICLFYNPYFKSGCRNGTNCDFVHLNETQYAKYCQQMNKQNRPTYHAKKAYKKCKQLIRKRQYGQSIEILSELEFDYPFNEQIYALMAKCYSNSNYKTEAKSSYQKLISICPSNPIHHNNYSMFLYRKLRNYKYAKKHFLTSFKLMPNHKSSSSAAITHGLMAKFLYEAEYNISQSQHHFEISLTLNFDNPKSHYNYAMLLYNIGYLNDAEYHFEQSISFNSKGKFLWHHFNYALLLKDIEKYNECEQQFIICCKLSIKSTIYHKFAYEYGLFLAECMNNYDLGLKYLQIAYDQSKKNAKYFSTYNYYKELMNVEIYSCCDNEYEHEYEWKSKESDYGNDLLDLDDNESISDEKKNDLYVQPSEINMPSVKKEFRRFVENKVVSDKGIANEYYNNFVKGSMNDIRFVGLIDENVLKNEIDMSNTIHRKMFMQQQEKFLNDCKKFDKWLEEINMQSEYGDVLSGNGILTFASLYYYVHDVDDLVKIIGEHNRSDADFMWRSTPKMTRNQL